MRALFYCLLALALTVYSAAFAKTEKPLKVIAPDLVIETAEQGAFYTVNEKTHEVDPRDFKPLSVVPLKHSFLFGWRLKVKTERQSVLVQERSVNGKGKQGLPGKVRPEYGYIFHATDLVETIRPHKWSYTVFVENQPIKTFSAEIR